MPFRNQLTYKGMRDDGKEEAFHSKYGAAVKRLSSELGETKSNFVAGSWRRSNGGLFEDRFPGDLGVLNARFQKGSASDARMAIAAAKKAFEKWRSTGYDERCDIFEAAAGIMAKRKFEFAALITMENGKNRYEAMADIDEAIDFLNYYAWQMRSNEGYAMDTPPPSQSEHPRNMLKPFGVWGVVSPFNFPYAIMAGMSAGAMLAGNTVVVKPASDTPWPAICFAEVLADADLPPGVFNVVTGPGGTVGAELVRNGSVSGFVFTGSRDVGMAAMKEFTGDRPKPFIAEMGGKNAVIVTSQADLEMAAEGIGRAAFGYGGQKCSACSRALVDRRVLKDFEKLIISWTESQIIGDPRARNTFVGPVINQSAVDRYVRCVGMARNKGRILTGGKCLRSKELNGHYVEPTIVDGLRQDHPLIVDELFLPFLTILPIDGLEKGIRIANSSEYGLTSGIMSEDEREVEYFMDRIEAGTIYSNRRSGASTAAIVGSQPFVGWKMSGTTSKAAGGRFYLQQFMREQSQTRCD